ncbi:hypothetical protein SAMN05216474_0022 [Lishizhenia tianjinensis]|uniref:Uncharacterized protein n=1 Tax=Lishizhenia tianjinensis TaxID=477690 RepID=A0A1I6X9E9_9FLAO|nr:hypothetical protein [Lishizhenia tianjinensis]SFT34786.1 hypothetical protein SAMN05216474_0022 [Lishizhenia tianjinensis]
MNYSFRPQNIEELKSQELLKKGSFLWIFHADKIPPHIGISTENQFYSIKSRGRDFGIATSYVFALIERKKVGSLFVQIKDLKLKEVEDIFQKYSSIPEGSSCLAPINKVIDPNNNFSSVGELLNSLTEKKELLKVYGIHLPEDYEGIPAYGRREIEERIKFLRNVKGR